MHWNNNECIDLLQKSFGHFAKEMTFGSVFKRVCIGLAVKVNKRVKKILNVDWDRLLDHDILHSCSRHDMDNGWVVLKLLNFSTHTAENELEGIKHGIEINTFIAKLLRPDSKWEKSKSKYFIQYINDHYVDEKKFIL